MENKELTITQYVNQEQVLSNIQDVLRDRTPQFITSLVSLVNSNEALKRCDRKTVLAACLTAASLNLPTNPSLGMAYIIPYGEVAQFQIGWKGLVELAIRTKRYRFINAVEVREGELGEEDPLRGLIEFNWIKDREERSKSKVIGYVGYFELTEGFQKMLYMTNDELEAHAKKYSQSYRANSKKMNQWRDDFDGMAKKTVLKLLINRFGPKSAELERAIEADQAVIDGDRVNYLDNRKLSAEELAELKEKERIENHINNSKTADELEQCQDAVFEAGDEQLNELYANKRKELEKK